MSQQDSIIRGLWELHKSPRSPIDYLLGTPRDYRIFNKMVEEGTLVQDFRFRGFPNRSMEKPTLPVTVPFGESPPVDETMTVWVRSRRQFPGGDGLVYGERYVDNAPRPRGFKNPPLDPPMDARQGYWRDDANGNSQNYTQELLQDLRKEKESYRLRSPQRGNMTERRGWHQNGYDPNSSQYQPSFGPAVDRSGADSPRRGTRVTDFIKHDMFEDRYTYGQGGRDVPPNQGGASSPRVGIPVTEFMKHEEFEVRSSPRQNAPDPQTSRGGASSPKKEMWGTPVTEFIKHDEFEGQGYSTRDPQTNRTDANSPRRDIREPPVNGYPGSRGPERSPGRTPYRLPPEESPLYDPFGRAGAGAPIVTSDGKRRTNVFGNFEKKMNYQQRDEKEAEEYSKFLRQQMTDRENSRQQERVRQRDEADQHFAKFDSQWGQMGGGAPTKEHRKINLDRNLGYTDRQSHYRTNAPYATGYTYGI